MWGRVGPTVEADCHWNSLFLAILERRGHSTPFRATWGSTRVKRVRRHLGAKPLLWFPWEGAGEAGEAGLGFASLNNFSRLCGIGAVPSCLVLGPGTRLGQVDSGPECDRALKEVDFGLTGLHLKSVLHVYYSLLIVCLLKELASPERRCPSRVSGAPDVKPSEFRK